MSKYEKREGIPPVSVRRKLQPEEDRHIRRACRTRWHGRYSGAIYAESHRLREMAKRAREANLGRRAPTMEQYESEWRPFHCERAMKDGYRAAKEGRKRHYPKAPICYYQCSGNERRERWLSEEMFFWYWGYDQASTEVTQ